MVSEALIFLIMVVAFIAFVALGRWPVGLALLSASIVGALLGGEGLALRHVVEGAFSYLDAILIIVTAMVFMAAMRTSGALTDIGRQLLSVFGRQPIVLLPALMLLAMLPGMLSGSSTAAVLTTGGLVAPVLMALGLDRRRAGTFIAMAGIYGMVAPPVNLPVMIVGAGIDIPYVGFEGPLLIASIPLAILTAYYAGWPLLRRGAADVKGALAAMDAAGAAIERGDVADVTGSAEGAVDMAVGAGGAGVGRVGVGRVGVGAGGVGANGTESAAARAAGNSRSGGPAMPLRGFRAWLPLLWVVFSMVASRMDVSWMPDLGMALTFAIGTVGIFLLSRVPDWVATIQGAVRQALPVLGILVGVGAFIQVMTLVGGRGWMVVSLLSLPAAWLYLAAGAGVPLFGAVSAYGAASVLGVPLVLSFLETGDVIVITAAISLLAALGDLMPPTALAGIFAGQVVGENKYSRILLMGLPPALLTVAYAIGMLWFS